MSISATAAAGLQLTRHFSPAQIELDAPCASRKSVLMELAELALQSRPQPSPAHVAKLLSEREKLGSTALGSGLALPHARVPGLAEPAVAALRLRQSIPFDAPDGDPVWLLFALLVPEDANSAHLELLAALARRLQQPQFVERLRRAPSPAAFCACFADD